jgi:hypothetical protein
MKNFCTPLRTVSSKEIQRITRTKHACSLLTSRFIQRPAGQNFSAAEHKSMDTVEHESGLDRAIFAPPLSDGYDECIMPMVWPCWIDSKLLLCLLSYQWMRAEASCWDDDRHTRLRWHDWRLPASCFPFHWQHNNGNQVTGRRERERVRGQRTFEHWVHSGCPLCMVYIPNKTYKEWIDHRQGTDIRYTKKYLKQRTWEKQLINQLRIHTWLSNGSEIKCDSVCF